MTWRKHAPRVYEMKFGGCQAFVFGCNKPTQLWAWAVYWHGGSSSGVEQGFLLAKKKAQEATMRVDYPWEYPGKAA